jgi:hypothetical protein
MEASSVLPACLTNSPADVLSLFVRLLPPEFFAQLRKKEKVRENNRVYTQAVVIWLMIVQRLLGNGTMETAVLGLVHSLPEDFWPQPCKRLQAGPGNQKPNLSSNTGSYNKARQGLPLTIVEQCADQVLAELTAQVEQPPGQARREAFFVDGSSMRMPHTKALCAQYPPGSNQHGASHWPILRIVVAHDLNTGLAMRPQWGPMRGDHAVSEQGLLEQAMDRLPKDSVVVGDANFGVFSVVYAATQRAHPVVVRLTRARAKHLAQEELRDGIDKRIHWKPSRDDRRRHPQLPLDACVVGRLIVRQVHPSNGNEPFLLALFTTLMEEESDEVLELYGQRWSIETDLRSLKDTLGLEQLTCTTPEMVAKEIDVAMLAYNLVRAVTCLAAQKAGLQPRQFSFTRVRNVINTFTPLIAAASDDRQRQQLFDDMMYYVGQAKLPKRNRKRPSYPRAVWGRPLVYPKRKP